MMRTCLSWIQPHPQGAILRHLLNMVNSFLCFSTNYFENQLLPNDLIIVRNHGDDEEEEINFPIAPVLCRSKIGLDETTETISISRVQLI
jgi:hypothetical protein